MKLIFVLLIVFSYCHSKSIDSYILNHKESKQQENLVINQTQEDYLSVLKHHMGLLTSKPSQQVINFLKLHGKPHASALRPLDMNYLYIIEGNMDQNAQQKIVNSSLQSKLELTEGKNLLLDSIYNIDNTESLVNQIQGNTKKEFYIYSQQEEAFMNYQDSFGLKLQQNKDGSLYFKEQQTNNSLQKKMNLQQCVNQILDKQYTFDQKKGLLQKNNSSNQIQLTEENKKSVYAFLTDVCAISALSKTFSKGEQPTFLAIHISSIPLLQKSLSSEEFEMSKEMLSYAINNASKNFDQIFQSENVYGQVAFINENDQQALSSINKNVQTRQYRVLAQTTALVPQQDYSKSNAYVLRAWFGFFFVAIVFFICYAMFTLEIQKDSLLYAKFIANDAK